MEATTHSAINGFNSHFNTSLVHLKHWKIEIDGLVKRLLQGSGVLRVGHRSSQGYGIILFQKVSKRCVSA